MRLLHFSDTHLGFQAFDLVNEAGINAREQDVYDAFEHVVNRIQEIRPDAVIHTGDFFHRPSPSNRALTFGLEQLRRVCDAGIPFYVIAGNHETPKSVYTSPILRAFRTIPGLHPVFSERLEVFPVGKVVLHCLPHINDLRVLQEELQAAQAVEGAFNLLLLHTSLGKRYLMEEYGEQIFPPEFESKLHTFQYIALGHWHNFQQINLHPNAWYCGATERFSDTESGVEKGFTLLDIDEKTLQCSTHFEAIPTRPWLKTDIARCSERSVAAIFDQLKTFADENDTSGAILSVGLLDITPEQSLEISNQHLRAIFPNVFNLLPKRRTLSERGAFEAIEAHAFDSLDQIFAAYIRDKYRDNPAVGEQLTRLAAKYFQAPTRP